MEAASQIYIDNFFVSIKLKVNSTTFGFEYGNQLYNLTNPLHWPQKQFTIIITQI